MSRWRLDRFARRRAHVVGIGQRAFAWWDTSTGPDGLAVLHTAPHEGRPDALLRHLADHPQARVHVVVGHALARHWVQAPVSGAGSFKELQSIAEARCTRLFGGQPGEWRVAGDWQAGQPFLCAAMPAVWLQAVEAQPQLASASWRTSLEAGLSRLAAQLPRTGWATLREAAHAVMLRLDHGGLAGVRVSPLPDIHTLADAGAVDPFAPLLAEDCQRWALREGWAAPENIVDMDLHLCAASKAAALRADVGARDAVAALFAAAPAPEFRL